MNKTKILKRLYKDYTKKYLKQILLAIFFSLLVAGSTSAIAWLLDPAIDKIFIQKDQSLLILIPFLIIFAFTTKGVSLYFAKVMMINVAEEIKKKDAERSRVEKKPTGTQPKAGAPEKVNETAKTKVRNAAKKRVSGALNKALP